MAISEDFLQIYRGDTYTIQITVTDYLGAAFNLTNYIATFTAKSGTTEAISVDKACTTAPLSGIEEIVLSSVNTDVVIKIYDYDIQIANTDIPPIVYTIARSKLSILRDITT